MKTLFVVIVTTTIIGLTAWTVHSETPGNISAFCALAGGFCPDCQNPCTRSKYVDEKQFFTSGCGEYCKERNGVIELIDFSGKNISSLGPEIGSLTGLKQLILSNNSLTELPDTIGSLYNLKKLY